MSPRSQRNASSDVVKASADYRDHSIAGLSVAVVRTRQTAAGAAAEPGVPLRHALRNYRVDVAALMVLRTFGSMRPDRAAPACSSHGALGAGVESLGMRAAKQNSRRLGVAALDD